MILSRNLSEAFNAQVNAEMWSSNLYLSMSVYFQKAGLNGFAHWMKKQAAEELEHAHKLIDYALDRGGDITIGQINVVPTGWGNPLEVFEHVYKHECYVSELIDKLVDIAEAEELEHAHKLIDYALDRGGDITIGQINVVPTGWGNPLEVFEHVYKHECYVSELIDKLVDIAEADKDHASRDFLFWFVREQVEEESTAKEIVDQLKNYGECHYAIMDHRLGKR